MTDLTNAPEPDAETSAAGTDLNPDDDHGAALDRSAQSISEAHEAATPVAAHDDITVRDDERAGEYSEDPGGEGGHP